MHDALLIAKREYLEQVRSRAFLFTTVLVPLLLVPILPLSVLPSSIPGEPAPGNGLSVSGQDTRERSILVIASDDAQFAEGVKAELEGNPIADCTVEVVAPAGRAVREELTRAVEAKQYDGLLWLASTPGSVPKAVYESGPAASPLSGDLLRNAITRVASRRRLEAHGISPEEARQLLQPVPLETVQVKSGASSPPGTSSGLAGVYVMILLLFFSVIYYGMNVARSVIQEKSSRIFEVLLATTRPESLMAGKLIGVGSVGLTQIGLWLCASFVFGGSPLAARLGKEGLSSLGITGTQVGFFVLFFLLGFLFYSAVAAAFGAAMSSEQEIQQFSLIILAPMIASLAAVPYVLDSPDSPLAVALSLFPPCAPVAMYLRVAVEMPPRWQLALSLALMAAATWGVLWLASRIYRVGILMYGKRATLPEILRWLRYS